MLCPSPKEVYSLIVEVNEDKITDFGSQGVNLGTKHGLVLLVRDKADVSAFPK